MVQLIKIFNATGMWTRPMLEHRAILGHLRLINPDMINHFTSQSQTCQFFKNQNA